MGHERGGQIQQKLQLKPGIHPLQAQLGLAPLVVDDAQVVHPAVLEHVHPVDDARKGHRPAFGAQGHFGLGGAEVHLHRAGLEPGALELAGERPGRAPGLAAHLGGLGPVDGAVL